MATLARITKIAAEVLRAGAPKARITKIAAEVLRNRYDPSARITHAGMEVLREGDPYARVTHAGMEVMRGNHYTYFKTLEIDAILKAGLVTLTKTLDIDAFLKKEFTLNVDIDAYLKGVYSEEVYLDSILEPPGIARAYGEENPVADEYPVSWATWIMSDGEAVTITGDADWGKLQLSQGDIVQSPVEQMGIGTHAIDVDRDRYGSGAGSFDIYIRGQSSDFDQLDVTPSWVQWTEKVNKDWNYGQLRLEAT